MYSSREKENIFAVLLYSIVILFFANFTLQTSFSSTIVYSSIGLIILIELFLLINKGPFIYIVVIFIASNFVFGDNQGGLFNITSSISILIYLLLKKNVFSVIKLDFSKERVLFALFFSFNILGYITHPVIPFIDKLYGFLSLNGMLLVFFLSRSITITRNRIQLFIKSATIVLIYSSVISGLKFLRIINSPLVILGGGSRFGSMTQAGVMGNSELFAELNLFFLIILTFVVLSKKINLELRLSNVFLIISYIALTGNLIATRSRSALILFSIYLLYILFSRKLRHKLKILPQRLFLFSMIFSGVIVLMALYVNLNDSLSEFKVLQTENWTFEGIINGNDINRSNVFPIALARMASEPWIVGFGWGNTKSNRTAWGISKYDPKLVAGYHNLYYSLPMIFGWVGGVAFLLIFILVIKELYSIVRRKNKPLIIFFAYSFLMILIFLLIDQFKISMLRTPNYFMIIWIFLGFSYSLIRKGRYEN